jgi:hypothetical protein
LILWINLISAGQADDQAILLAKRCSVMPNNVFVALVSLCSVGLPWILAWIDKKEMHLIPQSHYWLVKSMQISWLGVRMLLPFDLSTCNAMQQVKLSQQWVRASGTPASQTSKRDDCWSASLKRFLQMRV